MLSKSQKRSVSIANKEDDRYALSQREDHFYYNILMNNTGQYPIPASFVSTSNQTIIDDPSQYTVSIVRFQLLSKVLPIFNFIPQPGNFTTGNTNLNLGIYSVTMSYLSTTFQQYIVYSPNFNNPNIPTISQWFTINDTNFNYYQVFEYQEFINMINQALSMCYHNMPASSPPKMAGAPAPYLDLNVNTHIISLVAHRSFSSTFLGGTSTINIYMNHPLYEFFGNFNVIFTGLSSPNGTNFQLVVDSRGDNLITQSGLNENWAKWYSYITYNIGDLVNYLGINYRSITASNLNNIPSSSPSNWFAEDQTWNIGTTYIINDTVVYQGSRYLSKTNGNVGNNPQTSTANWELIAPLATPPTWDSSITYFFNNVVFYQGYWYISLSSANTGNIPSSSLADWKTYTGFDMYLMSQQYNSLYNWNDIQTLVFTSSLVPVVNESVPIQNISSSSLSQVQSSSLPILTDFAIGSSNGFDIKEPITFSNQGEYRLINMTSTSPLTTVDLRIYWTNSTGQFFPVFIDSVPNSCCTVKLLFRRKDFRDY